jgi:hypothetical protein
MSVGYLTLFIVCVCVCVCESVYLAAGLSFHNSFRVWWGQVQYLVKKTKDNEEKVTFFM